MRRFSWLIGSYIFRAVVPYLVIAWVILSVIVFVQQAGRFSDLLFSNYIPSSLVWQLTFALIPNVIAFTSPVAVLVGVIIGLSRMQSDNELVTLRAAGVGNFQIGLPIAILGILISLFAFWVNLQGVPIAAQIVRKVGLQAAINKLDSPVEPGVFNRDIDGFTIYVKTGDMVKGVWEDIFIYQQQEGKNEIRLITAKEGRIDSLDDNSELFLKGARIVTFVDKGANIKIAGERLQDLRISIPTKRGELIARLNKAKESPEEMGLLELYRYSSNGNIVVKRETRVLFFRKILLSITPLLFSLMGFALVTRFNRRGRGFGIFISLASLVVYYLIALLSEQLARVGTLPPVMSLLMPTSIAIFAVVYLLIVQTVSIGSSVRTFSFSKVKRNLPARQRKITSGNWLIDRTSGILDFDLVRTLLLNYFYVIVFLSAIFQIFTAFEMWKYAGTMVNGSNLLFSYLIYLLPFIYIQTAPTALMVSTLATYIIKARRNEIVVWTAAGVSVFRLLLPCAILMVIVGIFNFGVQEAVLAGSNRKQDSLRDELRTRGESKQAENESWIASDNQILRFEKDASDNESVLVKNLFIFKFSPIDASLQIFYQANKAELTKSRALLLTPGLQLQQGSNGYYEESPLPERSKIPLGLIDVNNENVQKPNHLDIRETRAKLKQTDSGRETRIYLVAIQRKYSTAFLPFIIMLFSAPFALSLSRKGNIATLASAVAMWLMFMGAVSVFEELGLSGYISPFLAVWSPLALFALIGLILLSRIRT